MLGRLLEEFELRLYNEWPEDPPPAINDDNTQQQVADNADPGPSSNGNLPPGNRSPPRQRFRRPTERCPGMGYPPRSIHEQVAEWAAVGPHLRIKGSRIDPSSPATAASIADVAPRWTTAMKVDDDEEEIFAVHWQTPIMVAGLREEDAVQNLDSKKRESTEKNGGVGFRSGLVSPAGPLSGVWESPTGTEGGLFLTNLNGAELAADLIAWEVPGGGCDPTALEMDSPAGGLAAGVAAAFSGEDDARVDPEEAPGGIPAALEKAAACGPEVEEMQVLAGGLEEGLDVPSDAVAAGTEAPGGSLVAEMQAPGGGPQAGTGVPGGSLSAETAARGGGLITPAGPDSSPAMCDFPMCAASHGGEEAGARTEPGDPRPSQRCRPSPQRTIRRQVAVYGGSGEARRPNGAGGKKGPPRNGCGCEDVQEKKKERKGRDSSENLLISSRSPHKRSSKDLFLPRCREGLPSQRRGKSRPPHGGTGVTSATVVERLREEDVVRQRSEGEHQDVVSQRSKLVKDGVGRRSKWKEDAGPMAKGEEDGVGQKTKRNEKVVDERSKREEDVVTLESKENEFLDQRSNAASRVHDKSKGGPSIRVEDGRKRWVEQHGDRVTRHDFCGKGEGRASGLGPQGNRGGKGSWFGERYNPETPGEGARGGRVALQDRMLQRPSTGSRRARNVGPGVGPQAACAGGLDRRKESVASLTLAETLGRRTVSPRGWGFEESVVSSDLANHSHRRDDLRVIPPHFLKGEDGNNNRGTRTRPKSRPDSEGISTRSERSGPSRNRFPEVEGAGKWGWSRPSSTRCGKTASNDNPYSCRVHGGTPRARSRVRGGTPGAHTRARGGGTPRAHSKIRGSTPRVTEDRRGADVRVPLEARKW